jgi:glycosyltransferase involved in cell wall biosynthesis
MPADAGRVSVVIPCYNHGRFLATCIESVLAQSAAAAQVIVVDDGSTDSTPDVAGTFAGQITWVTQPNQGLSAARNAGLARATGEFIHFLDADDYLHPDFLKKGLAALARHPEAAVAYSGYCFVDTGGGVQRTVPALPAPDDAFHLLLSGNPWPCHALLLRSAAVNQAGRFDPGLRSCEDWDFWLRIAAHGGRFVPVEAALAYYRRYPTSLSQNVALMYETALTVIRRHATKHGDCVSCRRSSAIGRSYAFTNWVAPQLDALLERRDALGYLRLCAGFARHDLRAAWRCVTHLRYRKRRLAAWLLRSPNSAAVRSG